MKLSECTFGRIVVKKSNGLVGMVSGISENTIQEPIPVIKWQGGDESKIHHSKLDLYEE